MTDLLNIARQCGADIYLEQKGDVVYECGAYLSKEQLHATMEKVCKPLVDYVKNQAQIDAIMRIESDAKKALTEFVSYMEK